MLRVIMRWFFRMLYHPFAWSYDVVAWIVSAGRWNGWVATAKDVVEGPAVLELGHGPGHLQLHLIKKGLSTYGLDESDQMSRQALRRITQHGFTPNLSRGDVRALPFPAKSFQTVVATFPSEYIIAPETLGEVKRVLAPGGRLVVLASAVFTGSGLLDRSLALLFRITGQSVPFGSNFDPLDPFQAAGLRAEIRWLEAKHSRLLFVVAEKALSSENISDI